MALAMQRLISRGYWDKAGEEGASLGGSGGGQNEDSNEGSNDDTNAGGDSSDGDSSDGDSDGSDGDGDDSGDSDGTSDADAKLLKEVMKRKAKNKELEAELKAVKSDLSKFDGINLDEVKAMLNDKKDAESKALEAKGDWDALKAQMKDANDVIVAERDAKISELESQLESQNKIISKLTLGHSFDTSQFINEDLSLSSGKARIIYGDHFDIEGADVVAYDKPKGANNRVPLVDASGENLSFDLALKKIVDGDPDKSSIMKVKLKQGANSNTTSSKKAASESTKLTGIGKISAALAEAK